MSSGGSTVSEDGLADSLHSMLNVSDKLQNGEDIHNTQDTENYLSSVGLKEQNIIPGTVEHAQRNAISAAAAVDSTGLVLKKWALSGDPAVNKLSRLEERLRKMQESSVPFKHPGSGNIPVSPVHPSTQTQVQQKQAPVALKAPPAPPPAYAASNVENIPQNNQTRSSGNQKFKSAVNSVAAANRFTNAGKSANNIIVQSSGDSVAESTSTRDKAPKVNSNNQKFKATARTVAAANRLGKGIGGNNLSNEQQNLINMTKNM